MIISAVVIFFIAAGVYALLYFKNHPCLQSHEGMVHHDMWIQFMMVGKVMVPIIHPEYDAMETICDVRK